MSGNDYYDGRYNNLDGLRNHARPDENSYKVRKHGFTSVPTHYAASIGSNTQVYVSIHKLINDYNAYRKLTDESTPMTLMQLYFKTRPLQNRVTVTDILRLGLIDDYKEALEAIIRVELAFKSDDKF